MPNTACRRYCQLVHSVIVHILANIPSFFHEILNFSAKVIVFSNIFCNFGADLVKTISIEILNYKAVF